jgi:hypothetical protein
LAVQTSKGWLNLTKVTVDIADLHANGSWSSNDEFTAAATVDEFTPLL